ncbi:nuclear transport factor 2 [Shewanella halifaxensis HAW-EB4]|uniref:Nuclear transport factor 2 n=1 Tax=Shewanella halifaxensis (strain HAW-EB4) TaxID=458817 RepID=B0TTY6_SHEHH|nr:nuclear transport factor 2 family protein [Shewanella halifaxensis]ABZ76704.1 nuclear transport factor 2 [Shewanella halifaxensis HAW-EB4]
MITEQFGLGVVSSYIEFLNNGNFEGIASLYSKNAIIEDPIGSDKIIGRTAIQDFYRQAVLGVHQVNQLGEVRVASNEIAFPFEVVLAKDPNLAISVIDIFKINAEGEIDSMRAFWGPGNVKSVSKPAPITA